MFPFNKYPYLNMNDLNLDWIINMIKDLHKEMDTYTALNTISWAGEWDIGNAYKQWSIVEDNGDGYISIVPVPRNVPISDTNYWVMVANFSALYAAFAQRITDLENAMTNVDNVEIPGLQSQIDTINNTTIPNVQTTVTELSKIADLSNLHILFVMDSYGWRTTTAGDTLDVAFSAITGATSYLVHQSGAKLIDMQAIMAAWTGDHDEIDTIVVIGGANDQNNDYTTVKTQMKNFLDACYTNYDNLLNVYAFCPGITFSTLQYPQFTVASRETTWQGYRDGCKDGKGIYIDNSQYIFRNTALLNTDYCHPLPAGMDLLVDYVIHGLIHRSVQVHYDLNSTWGSYNVHMTRDNAICTITFSGGIPRMFHLDSFSAVGNQTLGTLSNSLIDNPMPGGNNQIGYWATYINGGTLYYAKVGVTISEKTVTGYINPMPTGSPTTGTNLDGTVSNLVLHN